MNMQKTPKNSGFFMPAEWRQHKATWLAWPHDAITFPDRVKKVEKVFAEIIYYLSQNEFVELLVLDQAMQARATKILQGLKVNLAKIIFHQVDYADVWIRDYGCTFLVEENNSKSAWTKWKYNAYGEKFEDLLMDDQVTAQIKKYINLPEFDSNIIMEGGAIEVNGEGVLITTEECLLNPNRNFTLDKWQMEECLKNYTGASKIIWLKKGIVNDHTDGHIDEVARFVNENTIVVASEDDESSENHEILCDNFRVLKEATDQNGKAFNLVKLPLPEVIYDDCQKAPASYANFYIANKLVLVPQFMHKNDAVALEIIGALFPGREIVGINCTDLIYGGGTIHCITQQQPS